MTMLIAKAGEKRERYAEHAAKELEYEASVSTPVLSKVTGVRDTQDAGPVPPSRPVAAEAPRRRRRDPVPSLYYHVSKTMLTLCSSAHRLLHSPETTPLGLGNEHDLGKAQ